MKNLERRVKRALWVLEKLEDLGNERNNKIKLLNKYKKNVVLRHFFNLAYCWRYTFGIRPPPYEVKDNIKPDWTQSFDRFQILTHKLMTRQLTGNAAAEKYSATRALFSRIEDKWYTRILGKDLQVGVSEKTILKVWPDFDSKPPMGKGLDYTKGVKIKLPVQVESKEDGFRMWIILDGENSIALSPGGQDYTERLAHIIKACRKHFSNCIVDGEIKAIWYPDKKRKFASPWGKTSSLLRTGTTKKKGFQKETLSDDWNKMVNRDLLFYMFDILDLEILNTMGDHVDTTPQHTRFKELRKIKKKCKKGPLRIVKYKICRTSKEVKLLHKQFVKDGYEGSMIKNPRDGYYGGKKTSMWYKLKEEETHDYKIVGFFEGTKSNSESLGSILFHNEKNEVTGCGTGFKTKYTPSKTLEGLIGRAEIWKHQKKLLKKGYWIEVKFQKDPNTVAENRFPVFVRLRNPKDKTLVKRETKFVIPGKYK